MPESDARSLEEGAGKRCSRFWRKEPESDAGSVVMQKSVNGYHNSDGEQ